MRHSRADTSVFSLSRMFMPFPDTLPVTVFPPPRSLSRWCKTYVLIGVLDIDSPVKERFDETDAEGLSALCEVLLKSCDFSKGLL